MAKKHEETVVDPRDPSSYAPATLDYKHFFAAVQSNDVVAVEKALKSNININLLQGNPPDGIGAIHIATSLGSPELVKFLVSRGADVNLQDSESHGSSSALHYASSAADTIVMKVLLDHGADVEGWNADGSSPLLSVLWIQKSVQMKHREAIKLLIEHQADIHAVHRLSYETVLTQAAAFGDVELTQYLLTVGFSVDDRSGWDNTQSIDTPTPLCVAVSNERIAAVNFLIERGAKVDGDVLSRATTTEMFDLLSAHAENSTISTCTVLHEACRGDNIELVSHLLAAGLDVNARDEAGDTPFMCSIFTHACPLTVLKLLMEKSANISAKNNHGNTALHSAAHFSRPEIVALLIKYSNDINVLNDSQQTPLHIFARKVGLYVHTYAPIPRPGAKSISQMYIRRKENEATHPRLEVLRMLARAGADVNAQDCRGMTPLHQLLVSGYAAKEWLRVAAARVLLEAGANVNVADAEGRTVRDIVQAQEVAGLKFLLP